MTQAEVFKHGDLSISLLEERDLEFLRQHRNDFETWRGLTDCSPVSASQQKNWYRGLLSDSSRRYFIVYTWLKDLEYGIAAREDLGLVRIDKVDHANHSCRVGCDVFKPHRGKGHGTKIMALVMKYCFDFLNSHRLWLLVAEYNAPAIKIYTKIGFKIEGRQKDALYRNGSYHDYIMMSLLRKNYDSSL